MSFIANTLWIPAFVDRDTYTNSKNYYSPTKFKT